MALSLATQAGVSAIIQGVSPNSVPALTFAALCDATRVADGYVKDIHAQGNISEKTMAKENVAMQYVEAVCSAPPLNASAAVTTLKKVYVVVQRNATKDQ